jgi:hypothetical protein
VGLAKLLRVVLLLAVLQHFLLLLLMALVLGKWLVL